MNLGSGPSRLDLESRFHHSLVVGPWPSFLASLSLILCICEARIVTYPSHRVLVRVKSDGVLESRRQQGWFLLRTLRENVSRVFL